MNDNNEIQQGIDASDLVKVAGKLSNWKTYVIYALLAVAAIESGIIIWQRANVAEAKLEVSKKDNELQRIMIERDIAKANEKSCRVNLDDQNLRVTEAGKRYEVLQKEFAKLAETIAKGDFYKPADDLRKQPVPKTCQEALDFMNRNTQ